MKKSLLNISIIALILFSNISNIFIYADDLDNIEGTDYSNSYEKDLKEMDQIKDYVANSDIAGLVKELSGTINTGNNTGSYSGKKGSAIERFRNREQEIIDGIYDNTSFSSMMNVEEAKKQLDILSDQFTSVSSEFNDLKYKKQTVDDKYKEVKENIVSIISSISDSKEQIADRISKIQSYTKTLYDLKQSLDVIKTDIDGTKGVLVNYTNLLYKINNDFYGKDLNIDDIKLLIKSENIADSLSTEDVVKSLTIKLNELLGTLNDKEKKYILYTTQLNDLRVKYKYEVQQYRKDIENFGEQKKYLIELFNYLKGNKTEIDSKYKALEDNKKFLQKEITNALAISRNQSAIVQSNVGGIDISKLLKAEDVPDSDRFFSMPVTNLKRITAFFHDEGYIKAMGADHLAVDLAVDQGSEVYAPADGVVYKVVDKDWQDVNYMMVLHKNGYVTIYIHLNKILVQQGDFIKRGQLIALSGGKPGTRGAGYLSTGPHLHFNVIKNGQTIDPLTVTDISTIGSIEQLPQEYHYKYLKDRAARQVDLSKIKFTPGKSAAERRVAFLQKFGKGPFRDIALWEDAADGTNVDIDLGICIGYAESGLGWNLTSSWNIGNVGNNDRGDRQGFDGAYIGVRAIYSTLSNQYLKNHMTLDKLSRFGNPDGAIYASSDYNWEKNIVKCLSMIKGYRVPENYPFRKYVEN